MKSQPLVPVLVRMPPKMHKAIKEQATREDRSMAGLIRQAINVYLGSPPPRPTSQGTESSRTVQ